MNKCSYCDICFATESDLANHEAVHEIGSEPITKEGEYVWW